jgi:hypothetical protein
MQRFSRNPHSKKLRELEKLFRRGKLTDREQGRLEFLKRWFHDPAKVSLRAFAAYFRVWVLALPLERRLTYRSYRRLDWVDGLGAPPTREDYEEQLRYWMDESDRHASYLTEYNNEEEDEDDHDSDEGDHRSGGESARHSAPEVRPGGA